MNLTEINKVINDLSLTNGEGEFVIYGTGSAASKVIANLGWFYSKISYFIDSIKEGEFCGKKIVRVKDVNFKNVNGIIIASEHTEEILKTMMEYTALDAITIYSPFSEYGVLKKKIGRHTYGITPKTVEREWILKSVGNFCSINWDASIGTLGNHPIDLVTTSTILYCSSEGFVTTDNNELQYEYSSPVVIENDVWIGKNAIVLPGVTIHNGAIIGAGAVVTKDVPPYAIVGGVPAKIIRYRFEPHIIEALLEIKWWDWDDQKIKENKDLFFNPEEFVKMHYSPKK